ncbi:MAG TPA: TetR/AcrR family transcriptional regulator, partial [Polyangiaceae bacterium]|nr:TetR/AcrR family transcriptional regulator [Polyangiaceae bacterium]
MPTTTGKRGRPREFDLATALAAASETFIRQGYSGASLDALARAMQLNKPSLYAAFGDKRSLYLMVLKERYRRVGTRYRARFEKGRTLELALRNVFEDAVEVCLGEGGPPGCPIASAAATEALEDPEIGAVTRRFRELADKAIADWVRSKIEPERAPLADGIARVANGILYDIALRARGGETRAKLREIARDAA